MFCETPVVRGPLSGVLQPDSDEPNIPCFDVLDAGGIKKLTAAVFSTSLQQKQAYPKPINLVYYYY